MIGDILWTIFGIIGLIVVVTVVWIIWSTNIIRKKISAVVRSVDHHPTTPSPKDVATISSETVNKKTN